MDVKRVFDRNQAQLSRLLKNDESLYVSKAIQKVFLEINEQGVEAVAEDGKLFIWYLLIYSWSTI